MVQLLIINASRAGDSYEQHVGTIDIASTDINTYYFRQLQALGGTIRGLQATYTTQGPEAYAFFVAQVVTMFSAHQRNDDYLLHKEFDLRTREKVIEKLRSSPLFGEATIPTTGDLKTFFSRCIQIDQSPDGKQKIMEALVETYTKQFDELCVRR